MEKCVCTVDRSVSRALKGSEKGFGGLLSYEIGTAEEEAQ